VRLDLGLARRLATGLVALIAGTMLIAWLADLDVATRTDTLAPMTPLACVGFLAAAAGAWRPGVAAGALTALVGAVGVFDGLLSDGRTFNDALFGADVELSALTSVALLLLGGAIALDGRLARRLALAAGAVGAAAAIGFLLGVPLFYGESRSVRMSWPSALCSLLIACARRTGRSGSPAAARSRRPPRCCWRTRPACSSRARSAAASPAGCCRWWSASRCSRARSRRPPPGRAGGRTRSRPG
jgi:hypothetical protein